MRKCANHLLLSAVFCIFAAKISAKNSHGTCTMYWSYISDLGQNAYGGWLRSWSSWSSPSYCCFRSWVEYIEFCLRAKGKNVDRDAITELNEKFALPLNRYASRYSLGMKKRLMLLTLMLQDNDVVIMDEPFNGIDLAGTIVLRHWLKEMKAAGKCVILSSHIVSAISDICDEITYIHKGKVVADLSGMSAESIEHYILDKFL